MRVVLDPPVSVFSLSLYRHPFLYTLFTSRFTLIINISLYRVNETGHWKSGSSLGHHCGDIELAGYLANATGPVSLVLDLRIAHYGSSSDPSLNGHLHYPNDIDRSLNEDASDKIRKYRPDYNNNPPNNVSFIPTIASTSGGVGYIVNLSDFYSYTTTPYW
jgi:hypothetical protein